MKALIFAAGLGTRLYPFTKDKPKALVEINNKPMLQWQIENLIKYGCDTIVINVHHFAQQIIDFVNNNNFGINILISDERDCLLDTGGGLKHAEHFFCENDVFIVHNVDIYSDIDLTKMIEYHKSIPNNIASLAVKKRNSSKCLLFDNNMQLSGWKSIGENKSIISNINDHYNELAFSGIYVFDYQIFKLLNRKDSYPLIPELLEISKKHRISAYQHDANIVLDLGKPEALTTVEKLLGKMDLIK